MLSAAVPAASMFPASSAHRSADVPNSASTDAISRALNMSEIIFRRSSCVNCDSAAFMSWKMSLKDRMFPSASKMERFRACRAFVPSFVGDANLRSMFLRCVPPSEPFMPLSARRPRTSTSSVVPPLMFFAVPPTVRIASPSCSTDVFVLDAARAILFTRPVVSSNERPSADCASVTMSDARARSMPPADARLRTVGSISTDCCAV